jgi:integrase
MVKKQNISEKRRDKKDRILKENESQRPDGRYQYMMRDPITKKRKYIYSWKLMEHDPMPAGKKPDKSLREKVKELQMKEFIKISLDGGGMTVSELVDRYIATKRTVKPSTKAGYKTTQNWLKKDPFGQKRIDSINTDIAKHWLISLQDKHKKSYSSIHSIRGIVRPAFQYAVDADLIYKNPFNFELKGILINDSVKRQAVSVRDERRFLEFIRNDEHFKEYYDGILILFKTGLRLGELCGLTVDDIDLNARRFSVNHQLQYNNGIGKNVRSVKTNAGFRELPMTDEVYEAFVRVLNNKANGREIFVDEDGKSYGDFLFLDSRDKVMVGYQWEKRFTHIIEKYNKMYKDELPKITPHMCRHTYCTRMAASGININTLKYLMGHSSIEVTADVYTHLGTENAEVELDRIKDELTRINKEAEKVVSMPRMA